MSEDAHSRSALSGCLDSGEKRSDILERANVRRGRSRGPESSARRVRENAETVRARSRLFFSPSARESGETVIDPAPTGSISSV